VLQDGHDLGRALAQQAAGESHGAELARLTTLLHEGLSARETMGYQKHMDLRRSVVAMLGAAVLASALGGCGMSDEKLSRLVVAPGQYATWRCENIVAQIKTNVKRQRELKELMAKAGPSAGGQLVAATAYRPEYLNLHGETMDLQRAAREKKCKSGDGDR
jgi:hypothetical protein